MIAFGPLQLIVEIANWSISIEKIVAVTQLSGRSGNGAAFSNVSFGRLDAVTTTTMTTKHERECAQYISCPVKSPTSSRSAFALFAQVDVA